MKCAEIRELMLEADPANLQGTVESDLGRHLRECATCGRLVALILESERELAAGVEAMQPRTPVAEAVTLAAGRARTVRNRRRWGAVMPLAAAAGVATLVLFGGRQPRLPGEIWQPLPAPASLGVDVEAPAGKDVAIFDLEDHPGITVVWFFDQGEE